MHNKFRSLLFIVALILPANAMEANAGYEPDQFNGRLQYSKCQVCHSLSPADKKPGPSFVGLFGRKSGSLAGYEYSKAMKSADIIWDEKTLDAFLVDPKNQIPGTKMIFGGLPRPSDRADVIAHLKSLLK